MKKGFLLLFFLSLLTFPVKAQVIFSEDFEESSTLPEGWTTIDDPKEGAKHWNVSTASPYQGKKSLLVDCYYLEPKKEEWVISKAIDIPNDGNSYGLKFLWGSNAADILDKGYSNGKVKITDNNGSTWNDILVLNDRESIDKSGLAFPWKNWGPFAATINLSEYAGKTVKIAWVYYKLVDAYDSNNPESKFSSSLFRIDDIIIEKYIPIVTPIPEGTNSYTFPASYIGLKKKSENLILKNSGPDTLTVSSISGLDGTDFTTDLDISKIKLGRDKEYSYMVYYTPTTTGNKNATLTIHTNGGDFQVQLTGTKKTIPSGYTIESFEGEEFPPLGWTNLKWIKRNGGHSGDKEVQATLENLAQLTSPRLDLTASHKLTFHYYENMNEYDGVDNEFFVEFSRDGGKNWKTIWRAQDIIESYQEVTIDLEAGGDNCLVRWVYEYEGTISFDAYISTISLDDIILPPTWGSDQKPLPATNPVPASGSINTFTNDLDLSWTGSLHAKGYKLYIGLDENNPTSFINGKDLGDVLSTSVSGLDGNTKYYWKIVPYNNTGDAEGVVTWNFTTMADPTIRTFPYFYGFEGTEYPSVGWRKHGQINWNRIDSWTVYDGKYSGVAGRSNYDNIEGSLQMPSVEIPSDKNIQITFYWGNAVPGSLNKIFHNPVSFKTAKDVETPNYDTVYFEVKSADSDWKIMAKCSQGSNEKEWTRVKVHLNEYKGKTVEMRWRYSIQTGSGSNGAALDNITIEEYFDKGRPVFNIPEFDAGVVNYYETVSHGDVFTLLNDGLKELKITEVSFTDNQTFSTNLPAGKTLAVDEKIAFSIICKGFGKGNIEDNLAVKFEDGQTAFFPVKVKSPDSKSYYFTFDYNQAFATSVPKLKFVDKDGLMTYVSSIKYPGAGGAKAYMVMNGRECDWRNVIPYSGTQMLVAFAPNPQVYSDGVQSSDWLITEQITPIDENSKFRFFARSHYWDAFVANSPVHKLSVLVSTTDDNLNSFQALPGARLMEISAFENDNERYQEYSFDLSDYIDQKIYIAIEHVMDADGIMVLIDDISIENVDGISVGVNNNKIDNNIVKVYPNPVTSVLYIDNEYAGDVTITDMSGRIVYNSTNTRSVNVEGWAPNMYILKLTTQEGQFVTKFIKK